MRVCTSTCVRAYDGLCVCVRSYVRRYVRVCSRVCLCAFIHVRSKTCVGQTVSSNERSYNINLRISDTQQTVDKSKPSHQSKCISEVVFVKTFLQFLCLNPIS